MDNTIYEACYDVLLFTTERIRDIVGDRIEKVSHELIMFLTTGTTRYEEMFDQIDYFNFIEDKTFYKRIMMLIIASSSYYLSLYCIEKEINVLDCNKTIEELEELNYKDIIKMFYKWTTNSNIFNYIEDFCDYSNKNYIFQNNCREEVIKQEKIDIIRQINPFEIINYLNHINPTMMLESEIMIQDLIDIYESSLCYIQLDDNGESTFYETEDDFLIDTLREKIEEKYDNNFKIKQFYSYIFSNVYEGIIIYLKLDYEMQKRYKILADEFMKEDLNFKSLYERFLNDNIFAFYLIDFFLEINDDIFETDLLQRRQDFKKSGNLETLKKLDPFYEEEEVVYNKILEKRYPN